MNVFLKIHGHHTRDDQEPPFERFAHFTYSDDLICAVIDATKNDVYGLSEPVGYPKFLLFKKGSFDPIEMPFDGAKGEDDLEANKVRQWLKDQGISAKSKDEL